MRFWNNEVFNNVRCFRFSFKCFENLPTKGTLIRRFATPSPQGKGKINYLNGTALKKEDESILLKNSHYTELLLHLNESPPFTNICIVGYSFFKKDDYDIYDKITYTLLRDYAKAHDVAITIIDKSLLHCRHFF